MIPLQFPCISEACLWPIVGSVLENVLAVLEKNVYFPVLGYMLEYVYYCHLLQCVINARVSSWILRLDDLSIDVTGV